MTVENPRFYLLKVCLLDIEPEIWRRFVVPADIFLDELHFVIQVVMGWENCHLHDFIIGKKRYTENAEPDEEGEEELFQLWDLVKRKGQRFRYLYDFGDSWEHEITVESSRYADPELRLPVQCIGGARACPPEDIGGIYGYGRFCQAFADPEHEEHENYASWVDDGFNTEVFEIEKVNDRLSDAIQWSGND